MQNITSRTIRDIALELPQTTRIFESFKIDYCCGGRKMFTEACVNAGADPDAVLEAIESTFNSAADTDADRFVSLSLTALIEHIQGKHHVYTHYELENLRPLMAKVADRHGENHPELLKLRELFNALADDLSLHLYKEENILFPYILDLETASVNHLSARMPPFGTVQHPVAMMMSEHDTAGDILREMRQISNDYELPEGACPSYSGLFNRFVALEQDLHQHIHLENNLLFPRAVELERQAFSLGH